MCVEREYNVFIGFYYVVFIIIRNFEVLDNKVVLESFYLYRYEL